VPNSMTGFGQASFSDGELSVDVAVRSVNGKHLRTKAHLGISMPSVAERISALAANHMTRGTVDVTVRIDWAGAGGIAFNERVIASYVRRLDALRKKFGLAAEVCVDRVAQLPGAMTTDGSSNRAAGRLWRKIQPVVAQAFGQAVRMRASEGRALAAALRRHGAGVKKALARVERRAPQALRQYRRRLSSRVRAALEQAGAEPDPGALAREAIMYAERSDLSEEICRMKAHLAHFAQALRGEGNGRRLEFIAQEMHREANTMASKAGDPKMSEWIIDLRGQVDRIREQVANLE